MIKSVLNILGPVMVGPSSSHTAGAQRLGFCAYKLAGDAVTKVKFTLRGSFMATGRGHGTMEALLGGVMGISADDAKITKSFDIAKKIGLDYTFINSDAPCDHPNTVDIELNGKDGQHTMSGCSIGGGNIEITNIDGVNCRLSGEFDSLIITHYDRIGVLSKITMVFEETQENIVTLTTTREGAGKIATTIIELDDTPSVDTAKSLYKVNNVLKVIRLPKLVD